MYTIYGIPNCDIVKKVFNWMQKNQVRYRFHDYKKDGITEAKLQSWCRQSGWEAIFNKRSTTWKELGKATQASLTGEDAAIQVMAAHNSIIKRPVIEKDGKVVTIGFDEKKYETLFRK